MGFWYKQGSGAWNLYFYVTNLQGDITKIIDENGSSIGTYVYDAWGKATSISGSVAQANPLRYRGYYFDQETGFYWLGSRYYAPEIGRFVNADTCFGTGKALMGINLFAYSLDNPICFHDSTGRIFERSYDTDNDGEDDVYVYSYSFVSWGQESKGYVYIFDGATEEAFDNEIQEPEGFNPKTDLMVGDLTKGTDNPNMLAYQAHKVKKGHREAIVSCMKEYTSEQGRGWGRSKASVLLEWQCHHKYSWFDKSAQNVDFDFNEKHCDKHYYDQKAIRRGFEMIRSMFTR